MKKTCFAIILILALLSLSLFSGCIDTRPHAYLEQGIYECENIAYDGKNIDKITVGIREVDAEEYDIYDAHIIKRSEKAYYVDFEIWVDGKHNNEDYKATYYFDLRHFAISVCDDDGNAINLSFVTDSEDGIYYLSAYIEIFNQNDYFQKREESEGNLNFTDFVVVSDEIILKKVG